MVVRFSANSVSIDRGDISTRRYGLGDGWAGREGGGDRRGRKDSRGIDRVKVQDRSPVLVGSIDRLGNSPRAHGQRRYVLDCCRPPGIGTGLRSPWKILLLNILPVDTMTILRHTAIRCRCGARARSTATNPRWSYRGRRVVLKPRGKTKEAALVGANRARPRPLH